MHRILVTNDDGVSSDGIRALAAALQPRGLKQVVAAHLSEQNNRSDTR